MNVTTLNLLKESARAIRTALADRGVEHWAEAELEEHEQMLHEAWETFRQGVTAVDDNHAVRDFVIALLLSKDVETPVEYVPGPGELLVLEERARQALLRQGAPVQRTTQPEKTQRVVESPYTRTVVTEEAPGAPNLEDVP